MRQQVERARYEAELAQRRYLRVDPDNRLVADSLEAEWNNKLCALAAAQEDYERQCASEGSLLSEFWYLLSNNKKWWLLPILIILLLFGALMLLSGTAAAPFIYTLF